MDARHKVMANPRIKELGDLAKLDASDMTVMTKGVDSLFRANEKKLFASEGRTGGDAWPALSPAYAKQKARKFPGRKIMARTGRLRKSLTNTGPEHVADWSLKPRAEIRVGTTVEVAAFHIPGTLKNDALPNRDTLQMTRQQDDGLRDPVRARFAAKLRRVMSAMLSGQAAMRSRGRG